MTSVQWLPDSMVAPLAGQDAPTTSRQGRRCFLFTTSMDRNMILWSGHANAPSHDSGDGDSEGEAPIAAQVWTPVTRVGDVGGMLGGSVGANLLGFAGACLSPDGRACWARVRGLLHLYAHASPQLQITPQAETHAGLYERRSTPLAPAARQWRWLAKPFFTGHFNSVNCCAGVTTSSLLTSSDETSRVWAQWARQRAGESCHGLRSTATI